MKLGFRVFTIGCLALGGATSGFGQYTAHALGGPSSNVSLNWEIGRANAGSGSGFAGISGGSHAVMWSGLGAATIDLHPSSAVGQPSEALAMTANRQVGHVGTGTGNSFAFHAAMWSGSASSFVDINHGMGYSSARGVSASRIVGTGYDLAFGGEHAVLWDTTGSIVTRLNSPGYFNTSGFATSETQQVGSGWVSSSGSAATHALLWAGTASSVIDLHPIGYDYSTALALDSTSQVGFAGSGGGVDHAYLWSGSNTGGVDLNPIGSSRSRATSVRGSLQVGYANGAITGNSYHAGYWNGSSSTWVDLHSTLSSLPFAIRNESYALGISNTGDIYGYVVGTDGFSHPVVWTQPVPEPGTVLAVCAGIAGLLRRRRTK